MILVNLDFLKYKVWKEPLSYLKPEAQKQLLKEGRLYEFNGVQFKNYSALTTYLKEVYKIPKNVFLKSMTGTTRRVSESSEEKLRELFIEETPLFINTTSLFKLMLLSSNIIFSPNEKICITIMFENPYKLWSPNRVFTRAKDQYQLNIQERKIEESLERLANNAYLTTIITNNKKGYQLELTNLIDYIRTFENR